MINLVRPNIVQSAGYIPGEQPTDSTTIKLNTNENPYGPSPRVLEAIRAVTSEQLRRYPNPCADLFRQAAAVLHGVGRDWIMTFNGGDELLAIMVRACASEKDTVLFMAPSYSLYPVLTEIQGARKLVQQYKITDTTWSLPDNLEKTDASLLLICNPNAPSGHFDSITQLEQIAKHFRGVVVIDEAYVDFASESALPLVRKYENILILRTMSKGYSLAGLRFGYAIGQASLLREIEKVRDSYPCDAVAIAAATAALEDQPYARSTWQKIKAERARLSSALQAMGFTLPDSHANFVLAQIPHSVSPLLSAKHIYQSLKERNILVRWWDLPHLANKIRITVGTEEQNDRLLEELKTLIYSGVKR